MMQQHEELNKKHKFGEMLVKIEPYVLNESHIKKVEERMNRLYENIVSNQYNKEGGKKETISNPTSPVNINIKEPPLCDMV